MGDQDRISPYQINTISNRQVTRIKKNILFGEYVLVDSLPKSQNLHHKNCMADWNENQETDLDLNVTCAM